MTVQVVPSVAPGAVWNVILSTVERFEGSGPVVAVIDEPAHCRRRGLRLLMTALILGRLALDGWFDAGRFLRAHLPPHAFADAQQIDPRTKQLWRYARMLRRWRLGRSGDADVACTRISGEAQQGLAERVSHAVQSESAVFFVHPWHAGALQRTLELAGFEANDRKWLTTADVWQPFGT